MTTRKYTITAILLLLILGFIFYWFQYRPYQIKKHCGWRSTDAYGGNFNPKLYDNCLKESGL